MERIIIKELNYDYIALLLSTPLSYMFFLFTTQYTTHYFFELNARDFGKTTILTKNKNKRNNNKKKCTFTNCLCIFQIVCFLTFKEYFTWNICVLVCVVCYSDMKRMKFLWMHTDYKKGINKCFGKLVFRLIYIVVRNNTFVEILKWRFVVLFERLCLLLKKHIKFNIFISS